MSIKKIDFKKEVERVSRKSNIDIMRSEYSFNQKFKKLDDELDNFTKEKIREFNNAKKSTDEYNDEKQSFPSVKEYKKMLDEI